MADNTEKGLYQKGIKGIIPHQDNCLNCGDDYV
jgi:hypothetical protein